MEGKLIKKDNHYFLEVEPYTLSTSQKCTIIANTFDKPKGDILQLSLKNCQAIERGYDLYELAEEEYLKHESNELLYGDSEDKQLAYKAGVVDGSQTVLELMGDKKFTEEDMKEAMLNALEMTTYQVEQFRKDNNYHIATDIIQSLQQTEWDVEIVGSGTVYKTVLDCCVNYHPKFGCSKKNGCFCINNELPKLDAEGCLILKRK